MKKISILLMALVLSMSLAGCSLFSKDQQTSKNNTEQSSGSGGNGSNIAADMASMQMGMMMGQQMANQMAQTQNNNQQQNINQNQNNNQQPVNPQGGGNVAKFCPKCGTPNNAGSNFCPNCGTKLIL